MEKNSADRDKYLELRQLEFFYLQLKLNRNQIWKRGKKERLIKRRTS